MPKDGAEQVASSLPLAKLAAVTCAEEGEIFGVACFNPSMHFLSSLRSSLVSGVALCLLSLFMPGQ